MGTSGAKSKSKPSKNNKSGSGKKDSKNNKKKNTSNKSKKQDKSKHTRATKEPDCKFAPKLVKNGPCCAQKFDVFAYAADTLDDAVVGYLGSGPFYGGGDAPPGWWFDGCLANENGGVSWDGSSGTAASYGIYVRVSALGDAGMPGSYYQTSGMNGGGGVPDSWNTGDAPMHGKYSAKADPAKAKISPFAGGVDAGAYVPPSGVQFKTADAKSKSDKLLLKPFGVALRAAWWGSLGGVALATLAIAVWLPLQRAWV